MIKKQIDTLITRSPISQESINYFYRHMMGIIAKKNSQHLDKEILWSSFSSCFLRQIIDHPDLIWFSTGNRPISPSIKLLHGLALINKYNDKNDRFIFFYNTRNELTNFIDKHIVPGYTSNSINFNQYNTTNSEKLTVRTEKELIYLCATHYDIATGDLDLPLKDILEKRSLKNTKWKDEYLAIFKDEFKLKRVFKTLNNNTKVVLIAKNEKISKIKLVDVIRQTLSFYHKKSGITSEDFCYKLYFDGELSRQVTRDIHDKIKCFRCQFPIFLGDIEAVVSFVDNDYLNDLLDYDSKHIKHDYIKAETMKIKRMLVPVSTQNIMIDRLPIELFISAYRKQKKLPSISIRGFYFDIKNLYHPNIQDLMLFLFPDKINADIDVRSFNKKNYLYLKQFMEKLSLLDAFNKNNVIRLFLNEIKNPEGGFNKSQFSYYRAFTIMDNIIKLKTIDVSKRYASLRDLK